MQEPGEVVWMGTGGKNVREIWGVVSPGKDDIRYEKICKRHCIQLALPRTIMQYSSGVSMQGGSLCSFRK
jgi:hypothetical protein